MRLRPPSKKGQRHGRHRGVGEAPLSSFPTAQIGSKVPRNFQAPSRSLALAPYWTAWSLSTRGHRFTVKGHWDIHAISMIACGDVSAWDASWGYELLSAELDRWISMPS
eukprot:s4564_g1.t1